MPFSSELGMNVWDGPSAGAAHGERVAQLFAQGYLAAKQRGLDDRRIKIAEEEAKRKTDEIIQKDKAMASMKARIQELMGQGGKPIDVEAGGEVPEGLTTPGMSIEEATKQAFLEHAPQLLNPSDLERMYESQTRTEQQKAAQAQRHLDTIERNKVLSAEKNEALSAKKEIAKDANDTRLGIADTVDQRMRDLQKERLKSQQEKGVGASPSMKRTLELQAASDELDTAYESGDPEEIRRSERRLKWLQKFQDREHPDDLRRANLGAWKAELNSVNKSLGDITLKSQWPALEQKKKELHAQMDKWSSETESATPGGKATETKPQSDTKDKVLVISPDGKKGHVHRSQLKQAIAEGYKIAPE